MQKVIVPDGNTIVMDEVVFNQNPNFFMKFLVGSMVIGRVSYNEADRLELIFGRDWVKDILAKDTYTWQDYCTILDACI